MESRDLLLTAFDDIEGFVRAALDGIDPALLTVRLDTEANTIAWLVWHLARVQDDHLAGVGGCEQAWTAEGFAERFALPYAVDEIGYGHTSEQVGSFDVTDTGLLVGYHDAVHAMTMRVLDLMDDVALERVVDEGWDPPVTAAVRLVSVIGDAQAHLGQIGYVRGMAERRTR